MRSKLTMGLLSLFMMFSMTSCMEKVDAGCEGIKVNLYGSEKGVDDALELLNSVDNIDNVNQKIRKKVQNREAI